ncbi:MAG: hypothetical protein HQL91_06615 [Magnetococcales bacterium]|nr:hypothetical protein [Magnetococcales bacterium]
MRISMKVLVALLALSVSGTAVAAPAKEKVCKKLSSDMAIEMGTGVLHRDEFFAHYNVSGPNAIKDAQDQNHNKIPDAVEDVLTQMVAMREMLVANGFIHPLQQPRYQQVKQIHAIMLPVKGNGRAFEEPRTMPDGTCAMVIHVDIDLSATNLTPAHELFHLFQYGYTMFKRPWYLEGMARWSESMLRDNPVKTDPIPKSLPELNALFGKKYDANQVWNALAVGVDPVGNMKIPDSVVEMRYVSGKKVLQDRKLPGVAFMKAVLEGLDKLDDQVSTAKGLPVNAWPEDFQRDSKHDMPIWKVVESVYQSMHGR